jgi:hypothetical protein
LLASLFLLPTTPSGALWWFSIVVLVAGYFMATGQVDRLTPPDEALHSTGSAVD